MLRWAGMREASTAVFPVGCNPVGVLWNPGCEEGLAMVDGGVLGGDRGEGQDAGAAMREGAGTDSLPSQRRR